MSDIKLFQLSATSHVLADDQAVIELTSKTAKLEKDLQLQIEQNMEVFLGIRFLVSEHSTGKTHKGRIDSLGLDENGCPVIIEYKRHSNENVINQGLFYLDWLLDHQAEFRWLVMDKFGKEVAQNIEWAGTRLVCIASDFNKYDEHAVQQIHRNIELMRYRYFGENLLLLELVNATSVPQPISTVTKVKASVTSAKAKTNNNNNKTERKDTHEARILQADSSLLSLYGAICDYSDSLGDEVQRKELKFYTAFKRIKNFVSVQVWAPQQDPSLRLYMKLNPDNIDLIIGKVSDVRDKGHWGTGDLEVIVRSVDDLELAKQLIEKSYQEN
ncbi:DUF5655 domain-containing protein [Psychromonas antarctica]|uniref:DUF5655 domain-containing protein n=1 Tax=Psychromonas antarctica TaxID=67573 RepID=UPI001EE92518|nr:DUF5655 domain-containing protein [Psychromonas antarctica]MCG6202366.1 DUF5655 domain-containing protein [Psychromonas antarctica]